MIRESLDKTGAPSGRLAAKTVLVPTLEPRMLEQMWRVFRDYYEGVSRSDLERDLSRKQAVILLFDDGDHSLRGFSTLEVYDRKIDGRPFVAIFSGDTIIEPEYWGQKALHRAFVRYVIAQKISRPWRPVYWFLISKGYKTYLLLSRNFPEHWPRHDRPTPAWEKSLIDFLAGDKYGAAYEPERGVLRLGPSAGRLKRGIAPIESSLLEHEDIRFFVEQNPRHGEGDELCCIGRVELRLWFAFMKKLMSRSVGPILHRARRLWAYATASF